MKETKIGVIGLGLMGGSLCKALARAGYPVLGLDADTRVQEYALLTQTISAPLTEENAGTCDFLFLATYPGAAVAELGRWAPRLRPETIVCDLCGVKRAVCEPCFRLAAEHGFTYIGGHPMTGKQFSGIKYAVGDLYLGATMLLVPREGEDLFRISRLSALLREAGCE